MRSLTVVANCLTVAVFGFTAQARVLYVSPSAPGPAHDGTTWATAYTDVTPAVAAAQSDDELWVKRGSYTTQNLMMKPGVALYGGFAGTETTRSARNPDALTNATTLEGAKQAAPVVTIPASADVGTILDGFTVTGGTLSGIVIEGGSPILRNDWIHLNTNLNGVSGDPAISANGGGVFIRDGSPLFEENHLSGEARHAGGGVYIAGGSPVFRRNSIGGEAGYYDSDTQTFLSGPGDVMYAEDASITLANNQLEATAGFGYAVVLVHCESRITSNLLLQRDESTIVSLSGGTAFFASNTITDYGGMGESATYGLDVGGADLTAINNIFNGAAWAIRADEDSRLTLRCNDAWGRFGKESSNYLGIPDPTGTNGNISEDPLFAPINEFLLGNSLQQDSPCVDAGDSSVVEPGETDMDGQPRLQGLAVDMGAYEFPATAPAGSLHWTVQPPNGRANIPLQPAPVLTLTDNATGDTLDYSGPVTLAIQPGTGSPNAELSGNSVTAVHGAAIFPALAVSLPGSGYVLTATGGWPAGEAFTANPSQPYDIAPGATQVAFTAQPSVARARATLTPAPAVAVLDADGHVATDYNGPVTLSILAGGAMGARLNGNLTVKAVNGEGTFPDVSINLPGTGYVLRAETGSGLSRETLPFDMLPAPYFVSPTGDDTDDGTTWETAGRTIQTAVDAAAADPDAEIWVAAGTYDAVSIEGAAPRLYGGFSGTEDALSERDPARYVTTVRSADFEGAVHIEDSDGAVVDGFTLLGSDRSFGLMGVNSTATIRNNVVTGATGNIGSGGIDLVGGVYTVQRNLIHGNSSAHGAGIQIDVIGESPTKTTATIIDNVIEGNSSASTCLTTHGTVAGSNAQYVDVRLERNVIRNNTNAGALITTGYGSSVVIANNLIAGNVLGSRPGYFVDYGGGGTLSFRNNTVAGNTGLSSLAVCGIGDRTSPYPDVANNIFALNGNDAFSLDENSGNPATYLNNTFYQNGSEYPMSGTNKIEDPRFVNAAAGDYHLLPNSPCVDTGEDSMVSVGETDLDGRPRIAGAHVDRGAYEFIANVPYTLTDAAAALRIAGGMAAWDARRDITGDGAVDLRDAAAIAHQVAAGNP
jgi:hypothetical protein